MMTLEKANKILNIVTEYYPTLKNELIEVENGSCYSVKNLLGNIITIAAEQEEGYYKSNILSYCKSKLGLKEANTMFYNSIEAFNLLHEVGHIIAEDTTRENKAFNLMRGVEGQAAQFEAYRAIKEENKADQFAVECLNNESICVRIWAVMEGWSVAKAQDNFTMWKSML